MGIFMFTPHSTITLSAIAIAGFISLSACALSPDEPVSLIEEGASLVLIADDFSFTEGPAVDQNGDVFFTDQPNNRIHKWSAADNSISVFMENSGRANGLYFDHDGELLACADGNNELWKINMDTHSKMLVSNFESKRLNGPNDLWLDTKGGIYFTDPFYKRPYWKHDSKEIESENVYYLSPDRSTLLVAANNFIKPNGIIGTQDGKTLYVADIGANITYKYSINENGELGQPRVFNKMGSDGMTIDSQGNVYLTGDGVTVFNPQGEQILHIPVPESWTANVTFGGPEQNQLFITAMDSVYTLKMQVNGIR